MNKAVNEIINELWQKHPAIYRIDLDFTNRNLAVYSNNKELIEDVGYFLCDYVSNQKNADFLIAIIDLKTDLHIEDGEAHFISHIFDDGKLDYDHNSKLSYIYSKERFMIVGPASQNIHKITDFLYSLAETSDYSF